MIITVTANPALDYTLRIDTLQIGRRARYRTPTIDPSGKGINVARMLRRLGEPVLALGFAGGQTGDLLRQGLDQEGVPHDLVRVDALTRINVTLLTGPEGTATHLHGPGEGVSAGDVDRLRTRLQERLSGVRLIVYSGSLPPGMPPAALGDLIRCTGIPALVDAEGEALRAAISAGAAIIKPNLAEASHFLGRPLRPADALQAARDMAAQGAETVILTMGGDGAIAVRGREAWKVTPPKEDVVRAIGAGDSFAAGLAAGLSRGLAFPEALRLAAAAGAATALRPGTGLGRAEDVARLLPSVALESLSPG